EDLGVRHRLWVYSGRRGVHCWVCDDAVRKWSPALRAAAVEYLTVVKVETVKKVNLSEPIHPFIRLVGTPLPGPAAAPHGVLSLPPLLRRRSVSVVEKYFEEYALVGQDILGSPESDFPKKRDSALRWELLKGRMERTRRAPGAGKSAPCYADWEIMLQYCFPRLDINVSKGLGHLLKSPFSVHPKTGRISVPLDLQRLDQFDPFTVPTISSLCHELDRAGDDGEQEDGGETEPKRRARDYKKTSLAPYVRVFEQFVEEMERARRGERLRRS
ncbi:PRI1 primase, partial [Psophia crepitans]|nr:PRI1 primase [Psophia crepitans]